LSAEKETEATSVDRLLRGLRLTCVLSTESFFGEDRMKIVRLGKTELEVSRVGFGGIPIQRLTEAEAIKVVRRCLDLGITFIDTANGYTTSEERIGKAIAGRREQVLIATKTGGRAHGNWASIVMN